MMNDYIIGWVLYWFRWHVWAKASLLGMRLALRMIPVLGQDRAGKFACWALDMAPDNRRWNRIVGERWKVPA